MVLFLGFIDTVSEASYEILSRSKSLDLVIVSILIIESNVEFKGNTALIFVKNNEMNIKMDFKNNLFKLSNVYCV
jgi:ABC-type enterochelin transport system substrate-binding protein